MTEQSFQDVMSKTAAQFLQSVVVLDDQVVCRPLPEAATTSQVASGLKYPGKKTTAKPDNPVSEPTEASGANGNGRHTFELFQVVHGFAARGVVCGTLNPLVENDDGIVKAGILKAGKRADIVILDWQIDDDKGRMAMDLIEKLMEADNEARAARRRLVLIYTGDDVTDVKDTFDERFKKGFVGRNDEPYRDRNGFRVAFLSKPGGSSNLPEAVDFPELPEKAIEEFARMNSGLLSRAALRGLAVIRENTHRILSRFPPELDGAYLAHRAMTTPPQEAEAHIGPLLASELDDVLAGAGLEDSLKLEVVRRWLVDGGAANAESIEKMLSEGAENNPPEGKSKKQWLKLLKGNPHTLTEFIFESPPEKAKNTDEQFAALTTLRFPAAAGHRMTLGTVVRQDGGDYWLCVTPACDCVRLKNERHKLFFLRCKSAGNSSKVHFLVPSDGEGAKYIPITVGFKIEDGHHWEFKPDSDKQMVLTEFCEGEKSFFLPVTTQNTKLHWVAELKPAHARRITHYFASKWSRVGVTEAEWLRRSSDL
uniref:Response receiver domain-containing protein n=1 Tax=Candidatus Kentrum sp. DK TaxID=2126562 RepID=A0A450SKL4_9GAMM|nr:MAG: hypothetical protein BECKDK2373B_GA0170837_104514 [Candidatus Kentron sp. DK]